LLFSDADGSPGIAGSINPYFAARHSFAAFRERYPDSPLRYLVARLTGYSDEIDPKTGVPRDIKALIDAASETLSDDEEPGAWVIDQNPTLDPGLGVANLLMLDPAVTTLEGMGLAVVANREAAVASGIERISGYASWGSNDANDAGAPYFGEIEGKRYPGHFLPRSIASNFVSTNARSFRSPAKYGQSLIADLIRMGASGASGHVYEPALSGVAHPEIIFPAYARGVKAVEAFYRGVPYLGWMNLYVGDPLMTVQTPVTVPTGDRDFDGIPDSTDNCTEMPNPDQRDTNADGFGNLCDADIDGDGIVTTSWGVIYPLTRRGDVEWIALSAQNGPYDPNYDLDGNGKVDAGDVSISQLVLFRPPGPSGQARTR
jgi:uncharacterized protein (TIGR03790 family)